MNNLPSITVTRPQRLLHGYPWVFSNEITMDMAAKSLPPGSMVKLIDSKRQQILGIGTFNPHSLIAIRILTRAPELPEDWLLTRLARALALRERFLKEPYYRLVYAEADQLPGLIIDRFGDVLVCQLNTAGMDVLQQPLLTALEKLLQPRVVVFRNDSPVRQLEHLESATFVAKGELDGPIQGIENGVPFLADVREGQKTGWFYDQRDNRALISSLCSGKSVLDCYAYTGGFALQAAAAGARHVTVLDRSASAIALAQAAAQKSGLADRCTFIEEEAFKSLGSLPSHSFDIVILDPPAFVKSKKDLQSGLKGYAKLIRLAAPLVEKEGLLMITSCSHHVEAELLQEAVAQGLMLAGRVGRILKSLSAGIDHPLHPFLPESAYLKGFLVGLDY
ncbi:MAG: class I SAM-dependent rRNA methyltransferase [Alphaproteobacteria bacterium]